MKNSLTLCVFLGLLALAGCQGAFNPFNRPGDWSETGAANEALAQQVANKSDLIQGQSEPGSNGVFAVGGIEQATTNGTAAGIQKALTATPVATSISGGN